VEEPTRGAEPNTGERIAGEWRPAPDGGDRGSSDRRVGLIDQGAVVIGAIAAAQIRALGTEVAIVVGV
jgi:hypothetical protein